MRALAATLLASAALVGLSVQTTVSDLPFTVDISSFSVVTLNSWCTSQINTCDALCGDATDKNSCQPGPPPVWECACTSNHSAPGLQYYSGAIQSILCQQAFGQCESANAQDADAQKTKCQDGIQAQCGTLPDPVLDSTTPTATPSSATPSPTADKTPAKATPSSGHDDKGGLAPALSALAPAAVAAMLLALLAPLM